MDKDFEELLERSTPVEMRLVRRTAPRVNNADGTKFQSRNRLDEFDLVMVYAGDETI